MTTANPFRLTLAGAIAFAVVSVFVVYGWVGPVDDAIYSWLAPLASPFFVFTTELGSVKVLIGLAFVGLLFFLWRRDRTTAFQLPIVVIVSLLLTQALKLFFGVERPFVDPALDATTYSFPSGHASGSFALYGFLAYKAMARRPLTFVAALLVLVMLLVSISRVVLNVHYFSDVVGGWFVALTVIALSEWIVRRKRT